jgi:hypothetical protein
MKTIFVTDDTPQSSNRWHHSPTAQLRSAVKTQVNELEEITVIHGGGGHSQ